MAYHLLAADTTLSSNVIGGAQTCLRSLVVGLCENGWRVTVLTEGESNHDLTSSMREAGAEIITDWWSRHELMEDVGPRLANRINRLSPDIYLISVSPGAAWVGLPMLHQQIKAFAIAHTDSETFYAPIRHYGELLTGAVGVSHEICRRLVDTCNLPRQAVHYQPSGVTTANSEDLQKKLAEVEGEECLRLIYVGRLEQPQKRIMDLVALVKRLAARRERFTLDIVGDGPDAEKVTRSLAHEVKRNIVRLHGWVSSGEVIAMLRRADVFLLTSAYEGLPIALLEAMGNGVAPVVTDLVSGHRQLIRHDENGYLITTGNIEGFAREISALNKDRARLKRIQIAAWEAGSAYSVEQMVVNYETMFQETLTAKAEHEAMRPIPDFPLMESCRSSYPLWLRRLKVTVQRIAQ
jgi:glycosyltransferase involved in cell wall biosynthesis